MEKLKDCEMQMKYHEVKKWLNGGGGEGITNLLIFILITDIRWYSCKDRKIHPSLTTKLYKFKPRLQ